MKEKNKLLILTRDAEVYAELIERLNFTGLELVACNRVEEAEKYVASCNMILAEPALVVAVLPAAQRLQWLQSTYAGVEPLVAPSQRTDYVLTNVKDIFGPLMSEYVFAYILALERHVFEAREQQKNQIWRNIPYKSLAGRLIGICGLGSIGRHIAVTAKHFGMTVWGYKRSYQALPEIDRVFTEPDFQSFLAAPDYLVITLPNTPDTRHLIDGQAFLAMKNTAVLINVGRGSVVSENALIRAVEEKQIRGAILDVFEEEPLSPESRLWELPNVLITPHNSALSFPEDIVAVFAENYRRFAENRPLYYVVDFGRGY